LLVPPNSRSEQSTPTACKKKKSKNLSSQNNPNYKKISNIDLQNSSLEAATIEQGPKKSPEQKVRGFSFKEEKITRNPLIHNILRLNHLNGIFYSHQPPVTKTK
jgi:hypothetical protein